MGFLAVLFFAQPVWATGDYSSIEQLVGWSDDGTVWAVIVSDGETGDEGKSLVVREKRGLKATIYCEPGTDCYGASTPKVKAKGKRSALQRVNVEKDPKLVDFRLEKTNATWREAFKTRIETRVKGDGDKDIGANCESRLVIRDRKRNKTVTWEGRLCNVLGGYLHPNGKHALIKIRERYWEYGARGTLVQSVRYILVEVGT